MDSLDPKKVLEFLHLVNKLKHTPRTGWLYCDIENPETISGHMYIMGVMTFLLGSDSNLDRFRCLQLALIHDLAECIVGDITPQDNIPPEVKHSAEDAAMKELCSKLDGDIGDFIYGVYKEYEAKETPEAKFVKDLDRFDMIFTAAEYEERKKNVGSLQEFFDSTKGKFEHPFIKKLTGALLDERDEKLKVNQF